MTLAQLANSGGTIGQGTEQALLDFGKALERRFAGRAVDAVAGLVHHPRLQLAVGVIQIAEFAQRQETALDVFDARLDDAFLLRVAWRAGIDLEPVALGAFGIGPLHIRLVDAGFGDGAFGVVDDGA